MCYGISLLSCIFNVLLINNKFIFNSADIIAVLQNETKLSNICDAN